MDASELGRWTRFAAKGGIGKCTATQDCVAEKEEDLMFLKDDEITVLMQLTGQDDLYLGFCEGVVGRFRGSHVRFHARLKKPVMAKRSSTAPSAGSSPSRPTSSQSGVISMHGRASPAILRGSPSLSTIPVLPSSRSASSMASMPPDSMSQIASIQLSPSPSSPPASGLAPQDDQVVRLRSVSHSSSSTALDSAPRTPADFAKEEHTDRVRIVSLDRQVDSPPSMDSDLHLQSETSAAPPTGSPTSTSRRISLVQQDKRISVASSASGLYLHIDEAPVESPLDSSFLGSEPSARISVAYSDDGEVGIGLSLLQDFVNSTDADDMASLRSRSSGIHTPDVSGHGEPEPPDSPESTVEGHKPPSIIASEVETASIYSLASQKMQAQHPHSGPSIGSLRDMPSRTSMHPSATDSDYGGEEWEGASDIYDNYRYSRFSMASKMSRFSRGSMHTVASGFGLELPPPVPLDGRRPSLDSVRLGRDRMGSVATMSSTEETRSLRKSIDSSQAAPMASQASPPLDVAHVGGKRIPLLQSTGPEANVGQFAKQRPEPLDLASEKTPSPLLHTTFGSPTSTSSQHLTPLVSPALPSPTYAPQAGGAATAMRQRLEMERRASSPPAPVTPQSAGFEESEVSFGGDTTLQQSIVVDDDESMVVVSTSPDASFVSDATHHEPEPLSPKSLQAKDSSFAYEKQTMRSTFVVANQAPPPPYTPHSPVAASSSKPETHNTQPDSTQPIPRSRQPNTDEQSAFVRRSLFMPHPHAPKPSSSPTGPMYGRQPHVSPHAASHSGSPSGSVIHALRMALSARFEAGRPRHTTIYGKFEHSLSNSLGPVPIFFTLEPPMNIPANRMNVATRSQTIIPMPSEAPSSHDNSASAHPEEPDGPGKVIPRANFFPKASTSRPRSRSFSGFDSPITEVVLPKERSGEEGKIASQIPSVHALNKRSRSESAKSSPPELAPSRSSTSSARPPHKPSPLSLSQNNIVAATPSPRPPPSPLSQPPLVRTSISVPRHLAPAESDSRHGETKPPSPIVAEPPQPVARPPRMSSTSSPAGPPRSSTASAAPGPIRALRHSRSSLASLGESARNSSPPPRNSIQGRRSGETDISVRSDMHPPTASSPPSGSVLLGRSGSLRSKLSLPSLRSKNIERSIQQQDDRSPTLSLSPHDGFHDQRTVQVKDTDFELVKPALPPSPLTPQDDSGSPVPSSHSRLDASSVSRADSPAVSMLAGSGPRASDARAAADAKSEKAPDPAEVEAHRQRELRWISMMASVPASQARRNKKVRKLLQEGVPASVRYLVWAHLTDSKAKRMEGLYARLVKREPVAAAIHVEDDVRRCFGDHPELQDGSLVNLLRAYLVMVPDIQYDQGLTLIAGQLLLQSPEEDAFWTFISLMDTHLRPYFSMHAVQLEVDASLFCKAVESNDANVAKKVFVDMAIVPVSICRPWFSSLFVNALPKEHFNRVWDIFLYEGVPFLFRVGLAILSSLKQLLLASSGREAVMELLLHPPLEHLPSNAEAFLDIAFTAKLKDDDVRKQRMKMEAQVKRQTQPRALVSQTSAGSSVPSISLPRN